MAELRETPFGHEPPGVATRRVVGVVLGIGVLIAIALVAIWLALTYLVMPEHAQLRTRSVVLPPAPRLQPHPENDLAALREEKQALLEHYVWTDKSHRFARIPIERAMQIYVREHEAGTGNGEGGTDGNSTGLGTRDLRPRSGASGSFEKPQAGVIHGNKMDPGFLRDDEQKAGNPRLHSAGDRHSIPASPGGQR